MQYFKRAFSYVWPQWHRIVAIVVSVAIISVMFTMTIATVIPLLTVMMGSEGLHGWADRKIAQNRYDIKFYVPDTIDITESGSAATFKLEITDIDDDSVFAETADKEGLKEGQWIVGVGDLLIGESVDKISSTELLSQLVTVPKGESITVQYRSIVENEIVLNEIQLRAPPSAWYSPTAQSIMQLLPRQQSKEDKRNAVVFIIILLLVATLVRCFFRFVQNYLANKIVSISMANLRNDMFSHVIDMEVGYFVSEGSTDTVSRLIRDTDSVGQGIKILLGKTLREPAKAIVMLICAFNLSPAMTLIFLCGAPLTFVSIARLGKKIRRATKRSLQNWSKMLGKLDETVSSLKVVKVYNRQESEKQQYAGINKSLLRQVLKIAKINAATGPTMEVMGMIAGSVGLVFGAHWVYKGNMQPAEFFTILILLGSIAESLRKVSDVWNKIQQSNAGAERVYDVMDKEVEFEQDNPVELPPIKNAIEFKNISFTYPKSDREVLSNVNLSVKAGSRIALVGPNGSGKTTMASLLPRYYDPNSGQINFDGVDIKTATLASLREQISVVTQQVVTFNDTVAANIGYGKKDATKEEIIAAAKRSYVHEFIEPLPEGYDTIIGQNGSGFSGGQLQRIAIARAILKDPSILIFDEATSQIDADSEAKIHTAIEDFMQTRTSIVIAHRFSTIIKADSIVVLRDGQIDAQGTHQELIESCELYKSLYETQLIKD